MGFLRDKKFNSANIFVALSRGVDGETNMSTVDDATVDKTAINVYDLVKRGGVA